MRACLDSWAVLAWLSDEEPAADRVDEAMGAGSVISWINVVEVYYRLYRDHGRPSAERVVGRLRTGIEFDLPGPPLMIEAARLKGRRAIALGDCFAIATAAAHGLPLLTGDPEILAQPGLPCAVEDLRPA